MKPVAPFGILPEIEYGDDEQMHAAMMEAGASATLRAWVVSKVEFTHSDLEAQQYLDDEESYTMGIMNAIFQVFGQMDCSRFKSVGLFLAYLSQCSQAHRWPVLSLLLQMPDVVEGEFGSEFGREWSKPILRQIKHFGAWNHISCDLEDVAMQTENHADLSTSPILLAGMGHFWSLVDHLMREVSDQRIYFDTKFTFARMVVTVFKGACSYLRTKHEGYEAIRDSLDFVLDHWLIFSATDGWRIDNRWNSAPRDYRQELRFLAIVEIGEAEFFYWLDNVTAAKYGREACLDFFVPRSGTLDSLSGIRAQPIGRIKFIRPLLWTITNVITNDLPVELLFEQTVMLNTNGVCAPVADWCEWEKVSIMSLTPKELDTTVLASFLKNGVCSLWRWDFSVRNMQLLLKKIFEAIIRDQHRFRGFAAGTPEQPSALNGTSSFDTLNYVFGMFVELPSDHMFEKVIFQNIDSSLVPHLSIRTRKDVYDTMWSYFRKKIPREITFTSMIPVAWNVEA